MTYPMDESTQEYIDGKFARLEREKEQDRNDASERIVSHRRSVKRIVYVCAAILVILAALGFYLLYRFQLRAFF